MVATPGRLLHLNEEKILLLDRVSYLVVDEADRFMHGSMEEELRKVSPGNETFLDSASFVIPHRACSLHFHRACSLQ